ncbi:hypothetical protein ACPEEZ_01210 [Frigoribacterium sp. 2-23]|uniref:hypothetical protein n=1 Tax=Frigoribacterium sp. 2-23 TaxID=3415006 RepID=UPI003C6FD8A4
MTDSNAPEGVNTPPSRQPRYSENPEAPQGGQGQSTEPQAPASHGEGGAPQPGSAPQAGAAPGSYAAPQAGDAAPSYVAPQAGSAPGPYGQPPAAQQPQYAGQQPYGQPGQPQQAYGQAPNGQAPYGQYPGQPSRPERTPEQRKKRTRLLVGLLGGGALLLILIIVGGILFATTAAKHTPEAAVREYLDSVKSGQIENAMKLDGTKPADGDVLLTDAAYKKAKVHISGYEIVATTESDGRATVQARVRQGGDSFPQTFVVDKGGKTAVFFDEWKLQPVALGTVDVQVGAPGDAGVTVDGQAVTPADGALSLKAFPGQYAVALTSEGGFYAADDTVAQVKGFGSPTGQPAVLEAKLTAEGVAAANAAVDAWVQGCVASPELAPPGCTFTLINTDPTLTLTNQKWTLEAAPQYKIGDWEGSGWVVSSTVTGSVTFAANATNTAGQSGTFASVAPVPFRIGGVITSFGPDGAVFENKIG